jgi:hypothetical protein
MSRSCAARNALPEAIAMRGVAKYADKATASTNPAYTTRRAPRGPNRRFDRSVTRKANGYEKAPQVR